MASSMRRWAFPVVSLFVGIVSGCQPQLCGVPTGVVPNDGAFASSDGAAQFTVFTRDGVKLVLFRGLFAEVVGGVVHVRKGEIGGTDCPTDGFDVCARFITPDTAEGTLLPLRDCAAAAPPTDWTATKTPCLTATTIERLRAMIQQAPAGAVICVPAGTYTLDASIDVARDDITIEGTGDQTVFQLAPGRRAPVFVLGEPVPFAPSITRRNIALRKLRIRGYRFSNPQPSDEVSSLPDREHLRNNGVTVRQAENCLLEDLTIENAASGGIVLELACRNIRLHNVTSFGHQFDGVAWDGEITDSQIDNCTFRDNAGAGISFDIGPADNSVTGCQVYGNAKVGVFIRDCRRNTFRNCVIRNNVEDGVFIADGDRPNAAATDNVFEDNQYLDNGRNGIWQAGQRSVNNVIRHGTFRGNQAKPIEQSFPDTAPFVLIDPTILQ